MRYSGGASNDILGPGNGSMANAIAHRIHEPIEIIDGVPRYWTDEHHDGDQHKPLKDRGMKDIPGTAPTDEEIDAINGVLQSQLGANKITGPLKNIGVGYKTVPAPELNAFPGAGTDPRKVVDYLTGMPISDAGFNPGNGMYNNGYLGNTQGLVANVEAGALLPGQARKVWPRDSAPGKGGLEAAAGQFVLPGFKQEIPQISTGPYTGGAVGAPIGTYKGGSFAVPLPYYG